MSKWAKEWGEVAMICAVTGFVLACKGRWFLLACAIVLIIALSGCEFGHGR